MPPSILKKYAFSMLLSFEENPWVFMSIYICSLMTLFYPTHCVTLVNIKIGYRPTFIDISHREEKKIQSPSLDIQYEIKKTYWKMWNISPISFSCCVSSDINVEWQFVRATGNRKVHNKLGTNRWQVFASPHLIGLTLKPEVLNIFEADFLILSTWKAVKR